MHSQSGNARVTSRRAALKATECDTWTSASRCSIFLQDPFSCFTNLATVEEMRTEFVRYVERTRVVLHTPHYCEATCSKHEIAPLLLRLLLLRNYKTVTMVARSLVLTQQKEITASNVDVQRCIMHCWCFVRMTHRSVYQRLTGPDFGFSNTPQRLDSELASPGSQTMNPSSSPPIIRATGFPIVHERALVVHLRKDFGQNEVAEYFIS
ncbi:hypothetical protein F2P81_024938 [Scophthalmus maximus]|uniref:Uncharacterized protein n=1 Tax=Scophthalmus maximus TaxID=52904 RepID=A0A6A4RRM8_SCOMX|nr:hypothetical protein F2P81_024938 [Scophthalmus maximus]